MPLLLVGANRLLVAALLIANHRAGVTGLGRPPPATEQRRAPRVQRPAYLLHGHLWIFPPAAGPYGPPRSPSRSAPAPGAAPARRTAALHSASALLPSSSPGNCAR